MTNNEKQTTYDISCPYCFRRYTLERALFVDYTQRSEHIYDEYVDYMKNFLGIESPADRQMPLIFQKQFNDGLDSRFCAGTESGNVSYVRACPQCYNILPAAAGREKPFSIAVIGADDGMRGFYISTALHELNRRMLSDLGSSFIPADYKSARDYFEQYEEPLYVQGLVPEAMTTVSPLVYEYSRFGEASAETWDKNDVIYNRALIYIYNIDKELCDRYPMVAYNAIAQANGLVFVSDISAVGSGEPLCDPWAGFLTETFRRLYGANPTDKPSAILLAGAEKAMPDDRKWQALLKSQPVKKTENSFPTSVFRKQSAKIQKMLETGCPSYFSQIAALFSQESMMLFPAETFFEMHTDGTADINRDAKTPETSFLWLLSELDILKDDSTGNFRITR